MTIQSREQMQVLAKSFHSNQLFCDGAVMPLIIEVMDVFKGHASNSMDWMYSQFHKTSLFLLAALTQFMRELSSIQKFLSKKFLDYLVS